MPIELSSDTGPVFLEFEVHGLLTTDDLDQIVKHIDRDQAIQKIAIEIASENPAVLEPPELNRRDSPRLFDGTYDGSSQQSPPSSTENATDKVSNDRSGNLTDESIDRVPRLQKGSDPFSIMRIVAQHDGWVRTKEIVDTIPADWDVAEDSLNSNLWSLEDRGLVDKRSYEEDRRQKEYRATEIGKMALKRATESAKPVQS